MSNYPNELDDDVTLPRVDNNITQIGGEAINALRSAVFNIEDTLGINPAGTAGNLAAFLAVAHNPDGSIQPSVLTSLGLVVLPITDSQVSSTAGIKESKLALDYPTAALFSFIQQVNLGTQQSLNFITNHGSKIEPHIQGTNFNHYMSAILVAPSTLNYFTNDQGLFRDNSNLYNLFNDLNTDYIKHQVANSTPVTFANGQQTGGTIPPTNYAHVSAGIFLNTSTFSFIPETTTNLQAFAEFVDSSNVLLLGSRIQTLYQNGIPRTANSSSLLSQTQGQVVIPSTPVTTYLLAGSATTPVDSIIDGDNVIQFNPTSDDGYVFDALFSSVRVGDIITVNYGTFVVSSIITEIKYLVSPDQSTKTFAIRTDSKNLQSSTTATATVTRSLFNNEKSGVLALAQANHNISNVLPTLIIGVPSGAEVISVNFDSGLIDSSHYNLYIAVYPNGNPLNGIFNVPAIDISGNQGTTPGAYTLASVVKNINNELRSPGHNNRLMAFEYQGELGIKMTDSINNISFSIIDGVINPTTGFYNQSQSNLLFPFNAIGVPGFDPIDPSGLGPNGSGVSGPQFASSFSSAFSAQTPAKIIVPLTRKTFYVNGSEEERFALQPLQSLDGYGDGYWPATIISKNIIAGVRVETTYQVKLNLATTGLQVGKTITVSSSSFIDSGRYFISNIQFIDCTGCDTSNPASIISTNITVYDAIQSPSGVTPYASANIGTLVKLYFSADSVGFNTENLSDATALPQSFKRFMEIYVDDSGNTFSHERARSYIGSNVVSSTPFGYSYTGLIIGNPLTPAPLYGDVSQQLILANVINVSSKLRGFPYGTVDKINLQVTDYSASTGFFDGYLCNFNIAGTPQVTNIGPTITGKKGEVTRFYDQTNIEYVDILFDINDSTSDFSNAYIDIQLFPTLHLDQDVMLLGTALINNQANTLNYLTDRRQFGNISEQQLSTSAIDFVQLGSKYLHQNGVIRGFDIVGINNNLISISGGLVLVDGHFVPMNNSVITIPIIQEIYLSVPYNINWLVCVNSNNEFVIIPLTDFDPILSTPSTPDRVVTVNDLAASTTYNLDSNTFTNILNYRKDLTPLYLVPSVITGSGISAIATISTKDMRKYVVDENSAIRPTLTDQLTQGNFYSLQAALTWFKYNNVYQNTLYVKSSYVFSSDPGFAQLSSLNVIGDGYGAQLAFGLHHSGVYNFSGINFSDIALIFSASNSITNGIINNCQLGLNGLGTYTNITFNNCVINIGIASSFVNCTFNNCTINIVITVLFTDCTFNSCTVSGSSTLTLTDCDLDDCIITFTGTIIIDPTSCNNSALNLFGTSTITGDSFNNCTINPTSTNSFVGGTFVNCVFPCAVVLNVSGACSMISNTFNAGNSTGMLNLTGTSNMRLVANNFVRGATVLTSYISTSGTVGGVISDNVFDQTTTDGSNTVLISGGLSNFVFGPNKNWAPVLGRNISQPLIAATISGSVSDNGSDIALTNAIMAMKMTKVVNGATLVNFVISYDNNSVLGTAPTFSFNSVSATGTVINVSGTVNGSTGSGAQTTIVPLPANYAITDFNTTYLVLVQNSTGTVMSVTSVILSFTNLGYVGQN